MARPGYRDEKKADDEKSMLFSFRLHPESEDLAERELFQEFLGLKKSKGSLRRFAIDLYRDVKKLPEKGKPMPIIDTRKIMTKLDKVLSYLRGMKTTGVGTEASLPDAEYSDDFLSTLDRILDGGLEASDDSELQYYDEEEV